MYSKFETFRMETLSHTSTSTTYFT